ncbi:MAG: NAD(P)H-dependent oxidoreductase [Clostridia bacterium]|nr:NAD(P)H-dependent oxidoreductase [Clostridia bacterium]
MTIVSVSACPREDRSRTRKLQSRFEEAVERACEKEGKDVTILRHDLMTMDLRPIGTEELQLREKICDRMDWDTELVRPARELMRADLIVIGAPYWDFSFPSCLKVWVEHMMVRNLTFHYEGDRLIGHLKAKACVYLTTAGGLTEGHDWGWLYIQDVLTMLGVHHMEEVKAEGLDLQGSRWEDIMKTALDTAEKTAGRIAGLL